MTEPAKPIDPDIDWRLTTFDGVRREQMRRWAALPLETILAAQEEMAQIAQVLSAKPTNEDD